MSQKTSSMLKAMLFDIACYGLLNGYKWPFAKCARTILSAHCFVKCLDCIASSFSRYNCAS